MARKMKGGRTPQAFKLKDNSTLTHINHQPITKRFNPLPRAIKALIK